MTKIELKNYYLTNKTIESIFICIKKYQKMDFQQEKIQQLEMNIKTRQLLQEVVYGAKNTNKKTKNQDNTNQIQWQISIRKLEGIPLLSFGLFFFQDAYQVKQFSKFLYKSINYAVKNLEKPSEDLIMEKKTKIQHYKKKILLLDLDQTLIHCCESLVNPHVQFSHTKFVYKMNVRPYCIDFLKKISNFFDVFIFTASTLSYAQPIVNYLNEGHHYISGILHRQHCLRTKNGLFIKDLRIIENAQLKDIVIVDNKIHSFSFHLQNGIPVQQYIDCQNDRVLIQLESILMQLLSENNITQFLKKKLKLRQVIEQPYNMLKEIVQNNYFAEDKKRKQKQNI